MPYTKASVNEYLNSTNNNSLTCTRLKEYLGDVVDIKDVSLNQDEVSLHIVVKGSWVLYAFEEAQLRNEENENFHYVFTHFKGISHLCVTLTDVGLSNTYKVSKQYSHSKARLYLLTSLINDMQSILTNTQEI